MGHVRYRDREAALEAAKQNGRALQCASEDLKAGRGVVLEAVKQYGDALQYASEDFRNGGLKAQYVQGELAAADALAATFLCAAALPKRLGRGAAGGTMTGLQMLSAHGPHHDSLLKKRIAAFAGVPTAARLVLLESAVMKLS